MQLLDSLPGIIMKYIGKKKEFETFETQNVMFQCIHYTSTLRSIIMKYIGKKKEFETFKTQNVMFQYIHYTSTW